MFCELFACIPSADCMVLLYCTRCCYYCRQMEKQVLQTTKEYGQSMIAKMLAWNKAHHGAGAASLFGNVFSFKPSFAKFKGLGGSN
jgi:hypothetical protein